MADAGLADDRLPWLETPRPARKPARAAARRARNPLLLILGLLLASTVAVMSFLAGRGSGPFAADPAAEGKAPVVAALPPARQQSPLPAPVPAPRVVLPPPVETAAMPTAAPDPTPAAPARPASATTKRKVSLGSSLERPRGAIVRRNQARAAKAPPRYQWPAASTQWPSGRVIQLGAYYDGRQTMAAWKRVRRAYPTIATLPRKVTVVSAGVGRPSYYRLRIGAQSGAHARAICNSLHRIGRGCIIV